MSIQRDIWLKNAGLLTEEQLEEGAGSLSPEIQKKLTKKLKQFHGPESKIKFKNKGKYVHVKSRQQSEYSDDEYDHHTHVYEINHTPEGTIKLKLQSHSQIEESFILEKATDYVKHFDNGYIHGREAANDAGFKDTARSRKKEIWADNPHKKGTPEHKAWHEGASEGHQDALDLDM